MRGGGGGGAPVSRLERALYRKLVRWTIDAARSGVPMIPWTPHAESEDAHRLPRHFRNPQELRALIRASFRSQAVGGTHKDGTPARDSANLAMLAMRD